ncbi:E3 ubiquitin-protein ligase tom1 [Mycoemilia scoparia]|uniref:HECT-type E3 ubiquitin transferase n=1 Tax=Mycoemilia scoparia TaxID=417184 RepID=A0A9W8A479_9FUNG|nr:E3 ubiquitin-protein ligase tom1 [Mycoemilia scoparia]
MKRDPRDGLINVMERIFFLSQPWGVKKHVIQAADQHKYKDLSERTELLLLLNCGENKADITEEMASISYQFYRGAADISELEGSKEGLNVGAAAPIGITTSTSNSNISAKQSRLSKHGSVRSKFGSRRNQQQIVDLTVPQPRPTSEGLVTIDIPASQWKQFGSVQEAMAKVIQYYHIPRRCHYNLWFRAQVAMAVAGGVKGQLDSLLRCRILAISILSTVATELEFNSRVLSQDPQLVHDLVSALQPEACVPKQTQTCILFCIDALLRKRDQVPALFSALKISTNHGVLMFILKRAFVTPGGGSSSGDLLSRSYLDALHLFLTTLTSTTKGSQSLVSSGAVSLFVSVLKHSDDEKEHDIMNVLRATRMLYFIMVSAQGNAFSSFVSAEGVSVLVKRMYIEVDRAIHTSSLADAASRDLKASPYPLPQYPNDPSALYKAAEILPLTQISLLKALFKLLHHLLQQGSYQDRLRNIVETSLPKTLEKVIFHPECFGTNVYGVAIRIMSKIIYNEPTSLSILQESTLPSTFLSQVGEYIPYSSDTLIAIPNALGALCLNQPGFDQAVSSNVLAKLFESMSSLSFVNVFQMSNGLGELGIEIDEFMRHYASVCDGVMTKVVGYLNNVVALGTTGSESIVSINPGISTLFKNDEEYKKKDCLEDLYGIMLDSATSFVDGVLAQDFHTERFIEKGGWKALVAMLRSPLLSFDFNISPKIDIFAALCSQLFEKSENVLTVVLKELKELLNDDEFTEKSLSSSSGLLIGYSDPSSYPEEFWYSYNKYINQLNSASSLICLLYDTNSSTVTRRSRKTKALAIEMSKPETYDMIPKLLNMFRAVAKEDAALANRLKEIRLAEAKVKKEQQDTSETSSPEIPSERIKENLANLRELTRSFYEKASLLIQQLVVNIPHTILPPPMSLGPPKEPEKQKLVMSYIGQFLSEATKMCTQVDFTKKSPQLHLFKSVFSAITGVTLSDGAEPHIYLPVLVFYLKHGGVDELLYLLKKIWSAVEHYDMNSKEPETKEQEDHLKELNTNLEMVISLVHLIIDTQSFKGDVDKSILAFFVDSGDIISANAKDLAVSAYPDALLARLRASVIPIFLSMWRSPHVVTCSPGVMDSLFCGFGIITNVNPSSSSKKEPSPLTRGSESLLPSHITDFFNMEGFSSILSPNTDSNFVINQDRVDQLMQMGYSRSNAEDALRQSSNVISDALNILVTGSQTNIESGTEAGPSDNANTNAQITSAKGKEQASDSMDIETTEISSLSASASLDITNAQRVAQVSEKLKEVRKEFYNDIPLVTLKLLEATKDKHVFELKELMSFVLYDKDVPAETIEALSKATQGLFSSFINSQKNTMAVDDAEGAEPTEKSNSVSSELVGTHARYWAILLHDSKLSSSVVKYVKRFAPLLIDMLDGFDYDNKPIDWMSACLVFAGLLIAYDTCVPEVKTMSEDKQRRISKKFGKSSEDNDTSAPSNNEKEEGNESLGDDDELKMPQKDRVFNANDLDRLLQICINVLNISALGKLPGLITAVLTVLSQLTLDHDLSAKFFQEKGLETLFKVIRSFDPPPATTSKATSVPSSVDQSQIDFFKQSRNLFVLILRQYLESYTLLESDMTRVLENRFQSPLYRNINTNRFLTSNPEIALRNPAIFVKVVAENCYLLDVDPNSISAESPRIGWYDKKPLTLTEVESFENGGDEPKDRKRSPDLEFKLDGPDKDLACEIVRYLVNEILVLKPVISKMSHQGTTDPKTPLKMKRAFTSPAPVSSEATNSPHSPSTRTFSAAPGKNGPELPDSPETISYRCLLLQTLSELIVTFPQGLAGILVQRSSSGGTSSGYVTPRADRDQHHAIKYSSPIVGHLIHHVLVRDAQFYAFQPVNYVELLGKDASPEEKKLAESKTELSSLQRKICVSQNFWATNVLTTICQPHARSPKPLSESEAEDPDKPQDYPVNQKVVPEFESVLLQVRRVVMDHMTLAFRETISSLNSAQFLDIPICRICSLATLTRFLLTNKQPPALASNSIPDKDCKEIAKMMLERNLLDLMVVASSQIDLNHPLEKALMKIMSIPIEYLSKFATDISRDAALKKAKASGQSNDDNVDIEMDDGLDIYQGGLGVSQDNSNMPPDLYQNSALGISSGNAGISNTLSDSEMDDDLIDAEDYYDDSSLSDLTESEEGEHGGYTDDDDIGMSNDDDIEMDSYSQDYGLEDSDMEDENEISVEEDIDDGSEVGDESDGSSVMDSDISDDGIIRITDEALMNELGDDEDMEDEDVIAEEEDMLEEDDVSGPRGGRGGHGHRHIHVHGDVPGRSTGFRIEFTATVDGNGNILNTNSGVRNGAPLMNNNRYDEADDNEWDDLTGEFEMSNGPFSDIRSIPAITRVRNINRRPNMATDSEPFDVGSHLDDLLDSDMNGSGGRRPGQRRNTRSLFNPFGGHSYRTFPLFSNINAGGDGRISDLTHPLLRGRPGGPLPAFNRTQLSTQQRGLGPQSRTENVLQRANPLQDTHVSAENIEGSSAVGSEQTSKSDDNVADVSSERTQPTGPMTQTQLDKLIQRCSLAKAAISAHHIQANSKRWSLSSYALYSANWKSYISTLNNHIINRLLPSSLEQQELSRRVASERKRREDEAKKAEEEAKRREQQEKEASAQKEQNKDDGEAMQIEDSSGAPGGDETQQPSEPVIVRIGGEDIDIAGTGIDPEFLLALPEDMREEVYYQHIEETRQNARRRGENDPQSNQGGVSEEFLNALPEDIREEVLRNEMITNSARSQQEPSNPPATSSGSGDNISQRARQSQRNNGTEALLGDETRNLLRELLGSMSRIATYSGRQIDMPSAATEELERLLGNTAPNMPSTFIPISRGFALPDERGSMNFTSHPLHNLSMRGQGANSRRNPPNITNFKMIFQIIDRTELTMLSKHLFVPNSSFRPTKLLQTIAKYLCLNVNTCLDFIFILLSILQANASNYETIDQIMFHIMKNSCMVESSNSSNPVLGSPTPKSSALGGASASTKSGQSATAPKRQELVKPLSSILQVTPTMTQPSRNQIIKHIFPLSMLNHDPTAHFITQCCLHSLLYLLNNNPHAATHFLVEQPAISNAISELMTFISIGRKFGKKGSKGKESVIHQKSGEKAQPISTYPIVSLLSLLEHKNIYAENTSIAELLMETLLVIAKHLPALSKKIEEISSKGKASTSKTEGSQKDEPAAAAKGSRKEPGSSSVQLPTELQKLPFIPESKLRTLVNVLIVDECSSNTLRYLLSLINNLSVIPRSTSVISSELLKSVNTLAVAVKDDLQELLPLLKKATPTIDEADAGTDRTPSPSDLATNILDTIQRVVLSKFSQSSSSQSKLLRLLKALDYISTTIKGNQKKQDNGSSSPAKTESEALSEYHPLDSYLKPLWDILGECLSCTQKNSNLTHVTTVMLPLIESFMVVFKSEITKTSPIGGGSRSDGSVQITPSASFGGSAPTPQNILTPTSESQPPLLSPIATGYSLNNVENYFQSFTDLHKKVLNTLVRNNPNLLGGSFSLLIHNPRVLEFDNKRSYFYQQLRKDDPKVARPQLKVNVRRQYVFDDSYHQFAGKSGEEIRTGKLQVHFRGEEGIDVGGVTREWFHELSRQMFNPDYALFKPSAADRVTYQPNPQSWANPDHLMYFKFIGRVIGKAICDERLLDAYFTRSFYKHILDRKVDYRDVEAIDPEYFKSLQWMLENDITDVVEETFGVEVDDFGSVNIIDLIPNGRNIPVTEENKKDYVRLVTEQRLTASIRDQIDAFLQGFHDLVPKELIKIFNEKELELLISGLPDIDVDDWRNNTEYHGGYTTSSAQIQWFWRAVRSFDQEERAKLLQFVTGTSKVPLGGLAKLQGNNGIQKFQIHRDFSSKERLPTAHTCFNQLDLPLYSSYEQLRSQLLLAISEGNTGFGFV